MGLPTVYKLKNHKTAYCRAEGGCFFVQHGLPSYKAERCNTIACG